MKLSLQIEVECCNDYAELTPYLILSSKHPAQDKEWMKEMNISHVINCTHQSPVFPSDFNYISVPVGDNASEGSKLEEHFTGCFKFIDEARRNQSRCLLHCSAGISRSATVAIAYLMKRKDMSLLEAYSYVREKRPVVSPNIGFMEVLISLEMTLNGQSSLCLGAYLTNRYSSPSSLATNQLLPLSSSRDHRFGRFFGGDEFAF